MQLQSNKSLTNSGFTILELLVVLLVLGILLGTGVAGYRDFSRRQNVANAKRQIETGLRFAQSEASAGKRGTCSGDFEGYKFHMYGSYYEIFITCSLGDELVKHEDLDSSVAVAISGQNPFIFLALAGGTDIPPIPPGSPTVFDITSESGGNSTISINSQGQIQ